jgi:hypothetical protein
MRTPALVLAALLGGACRHGNPPREAKVGAEPDLVPVVASDPVGSGRPPPASGAIDEFHRLGYVAGQMVAPANDTVEQAVELDGNSRLYGQMILDGPSARYAIVDASGAELSIRRVELDSVSETGTFEIIEIDEPPVGRAILRLTGGPRGAALLYGIYFANGRRLKVDIEPRTVSAGSRVTIRARWVDGDGTVLQSSAGAIEGTVRSSDDATSRLDFRDDGAHSDESPGDGIFGAFFAGTDVEGYVHVDVRGTMQFDGYRTVRMKSDMFIVAPTGAAFVGEMRERWVDTDEDGRFDVLELSQELSFTKNGTYAVVGDLVDARGLPIAEVRWDGENSASARSEVITMIVPGEDFLRHGEGGPWTLSHLRLVSHDSGSLEIERGQDHVTGSIPLSSLGPLPSPKIERLVPSRGDPAGGYWVTLKGRALLDTENVFVDGQEATFEILDGHSLRLLVPPTTQASPGDADARVAVYVEVRTRWGRTSEEAFVYVW